MNRPDHKVIVRMNNIEGTNIIEGVRCEVFLPRISGESLRLRFQTDAKLDDIPVIFSIEGDVIGSDGTPEVKFISNKVYRITGSTSYWSNGIRDTVIIGEPIDLTIIEYHRKPASKDESSDVVSGHFMIEPRLNLPLKFLEMSYTGEINVKQSGEHKFTMSPGVDLTLDEYYSFSDENPVGKFECTPRTVAEFSTNTCALGEITNFYEIDDLLMLVSFIERQRHMCTGYVVSDSDTTKTYYRHMAVEHPKGDQSPLSDLIRRDSWDEFMAIAYKKMCSLDDKKRGFLRRAINCAISSKNEVMESSYITLYSGIESLVSLFLEEYPNSRCPMRKSFEMMRSKYNVDLQDLWPIYETDSKIKSLSRIRNELVHGRVIPFEKSSALVGAREHLKWTLERLLLGFFDWPIEKSNVSKDFLSKIMACYCSLKEDRSVFS